VKKNTPEAWHAEVLRQEIQVLTVAVRGLEFAEGFEQGRKAGFHEGVNALALVVRSTEAQPGEAS